MRATALEGIYERRTTRREDAVKAEATELFLAQAAIHQQVMRGAREAGEKRLRDREEAVQKSPAEEEACAQKDSEGHEKKTGSQRTRMRTARYGAHR